MVHSLNTIYKNIQFLLETKMSNKINILDPLIVIIPLIFSINDNMQQI